MCRCAVAPYPEHQGLSLTFLSFFRLFLSSRVVFLSINVLVGNVSDSVACCDNLKSRGAPLQVTFSHPSMSITSCSGLTIDGASVVGSAVRETTSPNTFTCTLRPHSPRATITVANAADGVVQYSAPSNTLSVPYGTGRSCAARIGACAIHSCSPVDCGVADTGGAVDFGPAALPLRTVIIITAAVAVSLVCISGYTVRVAVYRWHTVSSPQARMRLKAAMDASSADKNDRVTPGTGATAGASPSGVNVHGVASPASAPADVAVGTDVDTPVGDEAVVQSVVTPSSPSKSPTSRVGGWMKSMREWRALLSAYLVRLDPLTC
jgi:hypothetical protein